MELSETSNTKRFRWDHFLLIVLLGVIASSVIPFLYYAISYVGQALGGRARRVMLLSETDHMAFLRDCRTVLETVPPGQYGVRVDLHADAGTFPKLLLSLKPTYVVVEPAGFLRVEMLGGMSHFGVCAYPETFSPPNGHFSFGDLELVPGLWYYDDAYEKYPEFAKEVERLIKGN